MELVLLAGYVWQDAVYRWLVHLLAGGATGLVLAATFMLATGRPPRQPGAMAVLLVVAGHVLAAAPDALFALGRPHQRWMDVFLWHVSAPTVAGSTWTLLALSLSALAAYLFVVARSAYGPAPLRGGAAQG